jgi:exodeoxyribonuclease V gamma subunit
MPDPSANFRVLFAARTELLFDALARDIETPVGGPTDRECIVVQSQGMARWLELQLSAKLGVWAHPWFPYPEAFAFRLWRDLQGPQGRSSRDRFERDGLAWTIAAALPDLLDRPDFAPLAGWLGATRDPARIMSLARRIASVFYGYLLSRPELLLAWELDPAAAWLPSDYPSPAREDAAWQAQLWLSVVERAGSEVEHPARRVESLVSRLNQPAAEHPLPLWRFRRVSIFGLSAISPQYLRILAALGRHVPVKVYSLAASPAEASRLVSAVRGAGWHAEAPVLDPLAWALLEGFDDAKGHPLIADQAAAARAFQILVAQYGARVSTLSGAGSLADLDSASGASDAPPVFSARAAAAARGSLMAGLQDDLEAGRPPSPRPELLRAALSGSDRSISFHSCHGALREVEVLRDQLLAAFDEIEDLAPHEVVVMLPDVEAYAPYIEAIFGMGHREGLAIPFRIADRAPQAEGGAALAFSRTLRLLQGRMTAPELLDLLALAPLREARGLDEDAIETLRDWIQDSGIRWGLDAEHRAALGQPALEANTWRWGLRRLALGWATPGDGRARYEGVLPLGSAAEEPLLLGALADLWDFLSRWRAQLLDQRQSMADWASQLGQMLVELIGRGGSFEEEGLAIESALGSLVERAAQAGYQDRLGLAAVIDLVDSALAENPPARGFLEGAVTVCALQPMRAIPFRVLAIVGMNDGAFPRSDQRPGFDLAARQPRLGDNLRRSNDRLLFLEALICARDRLLITWTGRRPGSEEELPPSVVVSELLDSLHRMTGAPSLSDPSTSASSILLDGLVQKHPLHPFSSRYFRRPDHPLWDARWFSFASAFAGTASNAAGPRHRRPALLSAPLPPRAEAQELRLIDLDRLANFLEATARQLLRDRLGIDLPLQSEATAAREPMQLSPLDRHQVGESLLAAMLTGAGQDEVIAIATAEGQLPLGTPGRLALQPLQACAESLAALAAPLRQQAEFRSQTIELDFPELRARIVGSLGQLLPSGRVELGFGRLNGRRELRLWLRHLALCAALEAEQIEGCAPLSWAIGRAEKGMALSLLRFHAPPDATEQLAAIVRLWLESETDLVPFFPLAARAYLAASPPRTPASQADAAAIDAALRKAADAFGSGRREEETGSAWPRPSDLDEGHLALLLGDALPWDEDGEVQDAAMVARFQALAWAIYGPMDALSIRCNEAEAAALIRAEAPSNSGRADR